ncbi:MAG: cbb3-type cytochrome oxidase assembly protein CcoS [Gammaproteobacteria bacterium]|jgi:cbb3-type cytochrome oxidase maturation protein|nr:cbb3-type cytochrome oxidase assembly protein CcoS [Gammaproteobacteria bacterium]
MEIIYLLIPVSLILVGLIVWVFLWAVRSGQFDDMEGPAHQILMDDDGPATGQGDKATDKAATAQRAKPE